jgi:hypothetical protein
VIRHETHLEKPWSVSDATLAAGDLFLVLSVGLARAARITFNQDTLIDEKNSIGGDDDDFFVNLIS